MIFDDELQNPELRAEITALVAAKTRLDRLAAGGKFDRDLAKRSGMPDGQDGTEFFRAVFPFTGRWDPIAETELREVPLERTIGNSWRWMPENIQQEKRGPLVERFLSSTDALDRAVVCWIVPFGLFLAHEGKNRVEFLRSEGVSHYPALTTPYDYPAPDRLVLLMAEGPHGCEYWAVLDQDSIEPLRYPDWAVPVLKAYGVRSLSVWPNDYPSKSEVRDEWLALSGRYFHPLDRPPISLRKLKEKEALGSQQVAVSFMELPGIRLCKGWGQALACLVGALFLGLVWVKPEVDEISLLSVLLGAALMIGVFLFGKILSVSKRRAESPRE